jgi:hypothetical protein
MALRLFDLPGHPHQVAASDTDSFVPGGTFFLDFSRPLEHRRWFGVANRWIGIPLAVFMPVVHEGERNGGYVVGVQRSDPNFALVRALWKERYPSKRPSPSTEADGLKIIADFAAQFPDHCKPPDT